MGSKFFFFDIFFAVVLVRMQFFKVLNVRGAEAKKKNFSNIAVHLDQDTS